MHIVIVHTYKCIVYSPILCDLINLLCCVCVADFTGWTQAAVLPDGHRIDCEHFDERNCTTEGDCAIKVEHCKVESEKTSSCYVLWTIDRDTGIFMLLHVANKPKGFIPVFIPICISMIQFFLL